MDLQSKLYYQKCFDPECRGFRSAAMPLPEDLAMEVDRTTAAQQNAGPAAKDDMDAIFLQAWNEFEANGGVAAIGRAGEVQKMQR